MTDFPKYERYKDSGVEWLGEVPEHWDVGRVFSVFNERVETGHAGLPNLSITIGSGVQIERFDGARKKRLIEDLGTYKRAAKGDIAYNTMRMWQGAVGDVPVDGLVSPAYVVARPIKLINTRFYSYLFRTETFQIETNRHSYGIVSDRNRLYWLGFKNIVIPVPPSAEQDRIVDFLDRKTAEIDSLIAKKQRQIELLDEQKAILINRAVTRGLNPDAKLKPSGVDWIGKIPEGWEVVAFRRLIESICDGPFGSALTSAHYSDSGTRVINLRNIRKREFKGVDKCPSGITLRDKDLLFNRTNSFELVGKTGIYRASDFGFSDMVTYASYLVRLRSSAIADPEWLNLMMGERAFLTEARALALRSLNQANLTFSRVGQIYVPLPPLSEQLEIVAWLTDSFAGNFEAAALIEFQILRLQNLRSTLIGHTVTGKIKV